MQRCLIGLEEHLPLSVLMDHGPVNSTDRTFAIDGNKLRRGEKFRHEIQEEEDQHFQYVDGIYTDGKKDATLTISKNNDK